MSTTIAYSHKGGYWKTRYSFFASFMKSVGRKFFSSPSSGASIVSSLQESLLWKHNSTDSTKRTNFYGTAGGSGLSVAFNDKVSSNKIYKSFSIEGTSNIEGLNTFVVNSDNTPDKQFSLGRLKDKGGVMYGHIGLSNKLLDGSNIKAICVANQTNPLGPPVVRIMSGFWNIENYSNLSQKQSSVFLKCKYILLGADNKFYSLQAQSTNAEGDLDHEITNFGPGMSFNDSSLGPAREFTEIYDTFLEKYFLIFLTFDTPQAAENLPKQTYTLLEISPQNINGSPPRGQYAQAEILLGSNPYEVVSLNVNYEPTNLDHSK